jgi:hypothetical protein
MTNTGKVLIVGLLVVDLGVAGYLLFPKDERPPAATGAVTGSADVITAAKVDLRGDETHMVAGTVDAGTPPAGGTGQLAAVPPPQPVTVAPAAPPTPVVQTAPPAPSARPAPAVPAAPAVTVTTDATDASPTPAPGAKHAGTPPASRTVASGKIKVQPQTAQTKSKPVLKTAQTRGHKREEPRRNGMSPLSAAMTAQLVRESAKPDPSLPLPPLTHSEPTGRSPDPVGSAMTDQLVRESSRFNSSQYDKH